MKEIIAIVRMNKTGATKKALIESGAAGFTANKVFGRGTLVKDDAKVAVRKQELMSLASEEDKETTELMIDSFVSGASLFPMRLFNIIALDEDVDKIVDAIIKVNKTNYNIGDGKIFVLPIADLVRVRTGESGEAAM
ncbi:MAG: P-II family nitrogen regulator [Pelosinus sp.]|nr:P-II family nitrogen regulator [Pelosinus sp.]